MPPFSLGLAKLACPFYVAYYTKFMVLALQKAGGFEHEEELEKIAEVSSKAVEQFIADPLGVLRAPSKIMRIFGGGC